MNEETLRSLKQGMKNIDYWYGYNKRWHRGYVQEAIDVLENRDELLAETDCYNYLFD